MTSQLTNTSIAVVITAWNAEDALQRAVDCAQQRTSPVEFVIADDASTDGTLAPTQQMAKRDPRITVLAQQKNGGPAMARNRAFDTTDANWIRILDSDYFMAPDRLEKLLNLAVAENANIVADDLSRDPGGAPHSRLERMFTEDDIGLNLLTNASFVRSNLTSSHGSRRELGFLKLLISRQFLLEHGLTYSDMKLGEDYVLYASALARNARFLLTDPAGYYAVVSPDSLTGSQPNLCHAELMAADKEILARLDLPADARRAIEAQIFGQHEKWAWRLLIDSKRDRNLIVALACFKAPLPVAVDLSKSWLSTLYNVLQVGMQLHS